MKIYSISEPIASTAQQNTDIPTFTTTIAFDVPPSTHEVKQAIKHQYDIDTEDYWTQENANTDFRQKLGESLRDEEPLDDEIETKQPRLDLYLSVKATVIDGPITIAGKNQQYPFDVTRFDLDASTLTTDKRPFIQDSETSVKTTQSAIALDLKRQLEDMGYRGNYNIAVTTTYRGQPHGREIIPQYNDQPKPPGAPSPKMHIPGDPLEQYGAGTQYGLNSQNGSA